MTYFAVSVHFVRSVRALKSAATKAPLIRTPRSIESLDWFSDTLLTRLRRGDHRQSQTHSHVTAGSMRRDVKRHWLTPVPSVWCDINRPRRWTSANHIRQSPPSAIVFPYRCNV